MVLLICTKALQSNCRQNQEVYNLERMSVGHERDLAYCRKGERCGTRQGRLVLSITRPCSVSNAAATCANAALLDLKPSDAALPHATQPQHVVWRGTAFRSGIAGWITWKTSPFTSGILSSSQMLARCPGFSILKAPCMYRAVSDWLMECLRQHRIRM